MSKNQKPNRRSPEERIAELQAKIEEIKLRAERAKAKRSPALRHMNAALKAIDKAVSESEDVATRKALEEVRTTIVAALALNGVTATRSSAGAPRVRRGGGDVAGLAERLLAHLGQHSGQRGEEIADALGSDTPTMRPVLKRLIAEGQVTTTGRNRGTRYSLA
jgi:hypothetical protein